MMSELRRQWLAVIAATVGLAMAAFFGTDLLRAIGRCSTLWSRERPVVVTILGYAFARTILEAAWGFVRLRRSGLIATRQAWVLAANDNQEKSGLMNILGRWLYKEQNVVSLLLIFAMIEVFRCDDCTKSPLLGVGPCGLYGATLVLWGAYSWFVFCALRRYRSPLFYFPLPGAQ
jgi:hypothetical protein